MEGDVILAPMDITPNQVPTLSKTGPIPPEHPSVNSTCLLCQEPFRAGQFMTLLPLGPGADHEAQALCRAGEPYHGIGVAVHWGCGTGKHDVDLVVPN